LLFLSSAFSTLLCYNYIVLSIYFSVYLLFLCSLFFLFKVSTNQIAQQCSSLHAEARWMVSGALFCVFVVLLLCCLYVMCCIYMCCVVMRCYIQCRVVKVDNCSFFIHSLHHSLCSQQHQHNNNKKPTTHPNTHAGTPLCNKIEDLHGELKFLKIWPFSIPDTEDGFWQKKVGDPFRWV
jgi:hypothetical protein